MRDSKSYLPFFLAERKLLFVFISTVNVLKQTFLHYFMTSE